MAEEIGIAISGLCSFLFWPYPLTSNDPAERGRGLELAAKMTQAAHDLGTENLLVVPGAVHIPGGTTTSRCPTTFATSGAREAIAKLLPPAEKLGVYLNIENIFFNGYLMTPERNDRLRRQLPERPRPRPFRHRQHHDVPVSRALDHDSGLADQERPPEGVHQEGDRSLAGIVPAAAGRHDQLAGRHGSVRQIGYRGYLTFEYFHPYQHYPEALIYQTSDSLDRMLGIKA